MKKTELIHIVGSLSRDTGGPHTSLLALLSDSGLLEGGIRQTIICSMPKWEFQELNVCVQRRLRVFWSHFGYLYPFFVFLSLLRARQNNNIDVLNVHGIYGLYALVSILFALSSGCRLVISTRGMINRKNFLKQASFTKALFVRFLRFLIRGKKNLTIHVTSETELEFVQPLFCNNKIVLAPNLPRFGPEVFPVYAVLPRRQRKRLLYFGRCSKAKNLNLLVDWWASHYELMGNMWELCICGPVESDMRDRLVQLQTRDIVTLLPAVYETNDVIELFGTADASVHPSFSENFGHSIYESLRLGIPCIVTEDCPWSGMVRECSAGMVFKVGPENFWGVLEKFLKLSDSDHKKMRSSAVMAGEFLRPLEPTKYCELYRDSDL